MASKCWASCLGDCDDKMSGEHIVSASFFKSTKIVVEGFPWCRNEARTIGLSAFTKKCLCKKHNSLLSDLDSAAGHAAKVFNDSWMWYQESKSLRKKTYSINATLLERWLLKTLINISFEGSYFIGDNNDVSGVPSEELVKIVFGKSRFPHNNGLCVASRKDMLLKFSEELVFFPIIENSRIMGGCFVFWGLHLFLDLTSGGMKVSFEQIPNMHIAWHELTLQRGFKLFRGNKGKKTITEVRFNWRG